MKDKGLTKRPVNDTDLAIGRNVRRLREQAGMTLAELCALMRSHGKKLGPTRLGHMELGVWPWDTHGQTAAALVFGVDPPALLGLARDFSTVAKVARWIGDVTG